MLLLCVRRPRCIWRRASVGVSAASVAGEPQLGKNFPEFSARPPPVQLAALRWLPLESLSSCDFSLPPRKTGKSNRRCCAVPCATSGNHAPPAADRGRVSCQNLSRHALEPGFRTLAKAPSHQKTIPNHLPGQLISPCGELSPSLCALALRSRPVISSVFSSRLRSSPRPRVSDSPARQPHGFPPAPTLTSRMAPAGPTHSSRPFGCYARLAVVSRRQGFAGNGGVARSSAPSVLVNHRERATLTHVHEHRGVFDVV